MTASDTSDAALFAKYLAGYDDDCDTECLLFWEKHTTKSDTSCPMGLNALEIFTVNSRHQVLLLWKVFSCGGIFLHPNLARLSDNLSSVVFFLKCNIIIVPSRLHDLLYFRTGIQGSCEYDN